MWRFDIFYGYQILREINLDEKLCISHVHVVPPSEFGLGKIISDSVSQKNNFGDLIIANFILCRNLRGRKIH